MRIGIVGLIGSGKTTLLSRTFDIIPKEENPTIGTVKPQEYIHNDITIIDYPGSNSNFGTMNFKDLNYAIVLISGDGKDSSSQAAKELLENIISTKIPFLLCFTKIDKCKNLFELEDRLIKPLILNSSIIANYFAVNYFVNHDLQVWLTVFDPNRQCNNVKTGNDLREYIYSLNL